MQKFFIGLSVVLFATCAQAGEVKSSEDGAKCITISGEIELNNVKRSSFFGDLHRFRGVPENHPFGADLDLPALGVNRNRAFDLFDGRNSNNESFMDPNVTINFDIELVDNVRGFIQLENQQKDRYGVNFSGVDDRGGLNQGDPYGNSGTITQRGGDNNFDLDIEQAYIEWDGLIENLRMRAGIQDIEYDLRGDGNAFFLDIAESENIGPEITIPGVIGNWQDIQTLEFAGLTGTYTVPELMGGSAYIDGFLGTTVETGNQEQDQKLIGWMFDWRSETSDPEINNTVRFGNTWFNTDSSNWIMSWVMGADWNLVNVGNSGGNLELFGELVLQHGEFASASTLESQYPQRVFKDFPDGLAAPVDRSTSHTTGGLGQRPGAARSNDYLSPYSNDQEQKSWGYYFGFQYTQADVEWRPWVEFMYMYLSGDDGGWAGDPGKLFHANEDFVSFEDNDATIIVEENDYGLDIDTNYWKIQVAGGASLSPLFNGEADVDVKVLYAFFEAIDTPWSVRDDIGSELDLVFTWNYSQDLTFSLGAGWLWGSELFEDLDNYAHLIHGGPLVDIEDHASILFLNTELKF